jgi:hypothetical protein
MGQPALDHMDGVEEGQPVGVFLGLKRGFVHQAADGKMRHQQTEKLLADQLIATLKK